MTSSRDVVGILRSELDEQSWWKSSVIEPTTRHIPLAMIEDEFLNRCSELNKLIIEGLGEKTLRNLLTSVGAPEDEIKGFGSLKLLNRLCELLEVARTSGLDLINDYSEIEKRRAGSPPAVPTMSLFLLNELRQVADHRADSTRRQQVLKKARAMLRPHGRVCCGGVGHRDGRTVRSSRRRPCRTRQVVRRSHSRDRTDLVRASNTMT